MQQAPSQKRCAELRQKSGTKSILVSEFTRYRNRFFPQQKFKVFRCTKRVFFSGSLYEVVNHAHGPLQALLGVDGRGPQFLLKRINPIDLEGNHQQFFGVTLPKTNIAPENRPSQKETSLPTIHFQGLC